MHQLHELDLISTLDFTSRLSNHGIWTSFVWACVWSIRGGHSRLHLPRQGSRALCRRSYIWGESPHLLISLSLSFFFLFFFLKKKTRKDILVQLFRSHFTLSYFKGDFDHGVLHGEGTFTWLDGVRYTGNFVNNSIVGSGLYEWPDGR